MPEHERNHGPLVEVDDHLSVAVLQTYGGTQRSPVIWRGKVTVFYDRRDFLDIECTLMDSKQGGDPYIAWSQRQYTTQGGDTKYANTLWSHDRRFNDACARAVRLELGDSSAE